MSIVKKVIIILFALMVLCGIGCAGYVYKIIASAPAIDTSDIYSLLDQKTILYDEDGKQLDSLAMMDGNRVIVALDDMPQDLVNAVVAIEDKTFWKHHGFNFIRMIGAVKERLTDGGQIGGTSTITQQLARNIYLSDIKSERTIKRKIIEAYYTVQLEKALSKNSILEAYLNTVYFGFGSYGVQTAAQNYFSKNVGDLDLIECAALAALPQAPDTYALCYVDYEHDSSLPVLKTSGDLTYVYNGAASEGRRNQVLYNMKEDGYITAEQKEAAGGEDLEKHLKINVKSKDKHNTAYFTDYAIDQVMHDLEEVLGLSKETASDMVYSGGLSIYTTLDREKQEILSEEFADSDNYTSIAYYNTDGDGNVVSDRGKILLYKYGNVYTDDGELFILEDDYEKDSSGDIVIEGGDTVSFFEDGDGKAVISVSDIFRQRDGSFYILQDGRVDLPSEYVHINTDGAFVISAKAFSDDRKPVREDDGDLIFSSDFCSKGTESRQPQAAAVLLEKATGEIKAMMGGRGKTTGRMLYNRAVEPHQPGSSIKPIAVYGPALQRSAVLADDGETMKLDYSKGDYWGNYITAASVINDAPMYLNGKRWPQNAYNGYRGRMSLRKAVQQSVNVCAVKVFRQIGEDQAISMLKKNGITSVVESGDANDQNAAALALGGMTNGISPLELSAAYETFVNGGVYKEPVSYTKVVDRSGEVVLEKEQKTAKVYDEGVAWIMTDILRTVVTNGIAKNARIGNQPVGGKTGTTSDQYDIWFAGFTPQYTMALWEGNDVHIRLSSMSESAAYFWSQIMRRVCEDIDYEEFEEKPDNVIYSRGEYFVEGTTGGKYPSTKEKKSKDDDDEDETKATTKEKKKEPTKKPSSSGNSSNSSGSSPSSGSGDSGTDEDYAYFEDFFEE